jgi:methionine-rich copper-binding protein CopC
MTITPARLALLFLGGGLLAFAAWNWFLPRARYSTSNPAPNAVLSQLPDTLSVQFTDDLGTESTLALVSTITLSASGEKVYGDGKRSTASGPSLDSRRALSIKLDPDLPNGLYWVSWSTVAAHGGAKSFGNFCFSVGMPIPEGVTRDRQSAVVQHDYRYRDQRAVFVGGAVLIGIALILPHFIGQRSTYQ